MANPIDLATLFREQIGGRRNLIINGAMQVAQRGTSVTGITAHGYYTVDRFKIGYSSLGTWTQSQDSDAPDGFSSSLKFECTTTDPSPAAGDYFLFYYSFEGQDLQHLKKGTSSAESVTASFWVKSNKTGTYILELLDSNNSYRHINKSYTVNVSGTWEYKTITFEGDTTGTLNNDNTQSLILEFFLAAGSTYAGGSALQTSWGVSDNPSRAVGQVNLGDTTSNYFQITGLQLEVGETATPFEHRSYGEELALCQRYYQELTIPLDYTSSSNASALYRSYTLPTTMRASSPATAVVTQLRYWSGAGGVNFTPTLYGYADRVRVDGTGLTNGRGFVDGKISMDAEL